MKVPRKASRGEIPLSAVTTAWLLSLESRLAQAENARGLGWHPTKQWVFIDRQCLEMFSCYKVNKYKTVRSQRNEYSFRSSSCRKAKNPDVADKKTCYRINGCFNNPRNRCNFSCHRVFSLTWPASMQMYWNKRKRLHKKRVHLPQDWFGTPTWPPFYCLGIPISPPRRHVKTLYTHERISSEVEANTSEDPEELPTATHADAGKKSAKYDISCTKNRRRDIFT